MLVKECKVDRIEVVKGYVVQVREVQSIFDNGVKIAEAFHRALLVPGDDVSAQDPKVQAICAAIWTPEVVAEYQARLAEAARPPQNP